MEHLILKTNYIKTPLGRIIIATDPKGRVRAVEFEDLIARMHRLLRIHYGAERIHLVTSKRRPDAARALQHYFDGDLSALDHIEVATAGTPFQQSVWTALRQIKSGMTCSYGSLARRIGRPTASRAVGLANGSNPIPIIIPCHRVIGADGSMTGYGGGLTRKRWLLSHENTEHQFDILRGGDEHGC